MMKNRATSYMLGFCLALTGSLMLVSHSMSATTNLQINQGWNLVGNGNTDTVTVATTFGSAPVTSVWKWNASTSTWSFYTPSFSDGGQAYATTKGYQQLLTINPGDGFWINASSAFTLPAFTGSTYGAANFQTGAAGQMIKGWNLIATGDTLTPSQFNSGLSITPPSAGVTPQNVTTLWAWDSVKSNWYFYAPSLEAQSSTALASYIASKGYLDFSTNSKTLGTGVGFWVNNPNEPTATTQSKSTTTVVSTTSTSLAVGVTTTTTVKSTTTTTATSQVTSDATSYAPATFATTITASYTPSGSLTSTTAFVSKARFMIGDATTQSFWATGTKSTDTYPLVGETLGSNTTYKDYLSKVFQTVVDSSNSSCFRIDAHLHSNYSLDVDTSSSNTLTLRNNWGISTSSDYGYVCFSYDSSTKLLKAVKRYTYNISTYKHEAVSSFAQANYYVNYANGTAKLVASSANATPLTIYKSPIDFGMPPDFNPNSSTGSSNSAMPFSESYRKINTGYLQALFTQASTSVKSQISANGSTATLGYNTTTVAAQDAMLTTIAATATANNFKLRYPLATYKVFRDAALKYKIYGDSVLDGTIGENTVPMVYFTNGKDASGAYHPAMIVVAFSVPDGPHYLADIIKPPGGGDASVTVCNQGSTTQTGYSNQCVTRGTARQNFFFRVPMRDYGLTSDLCDNTTPARGDLYSDYKASTAAYCNTANDTVENYASISDNGVMIDGTSIYPVLNNVLITSQEEPSLNMHGCHVGQGYGYHCHSDGFSAIGNGLSLYNESDYVGKNHPPLIGMGYDGIALYGKYLSKYASMTGYTASTTKPTSSATPSGNDLDAYGGHTHAIDGVSSYHQHSRPYTTVTIAQPGSSSTASKTYTIHSLITGAWRGKINSIPDFWLGTKPNTSGKYPSMTD